MAITVTHTKTNTIADFTQEKLNELISLGQYPQGTTLADIVLPSDWNADHTSTDLDNLESSVRGVSVIDMDSGNYTMTEAQSFTELIVLQNTAGMTLTIPTAYNDNLPRIQTFSTAGTSAVTIAYEAGSNLTLEANTITQIIHLPALGLIFDLAVYYGTHARQVSAEPLKLTSASLASPAVAGEFEFNSNALYANPAASGRGVLKASHFVNNNANVTLNDDANPQSPFSSSSDTLTVTASTYRFRCGLFLTTGSTSHAISFGFAGTATFDSCTYYADARVAGATNRGGAVSVWVDSASSTAIIIATTATGTAIIIDGTFRISSAGTIIPQITFSSAPGGTNLCLKNSYFECNPIGSYTVNNIGNWS